MKNRDNKQLKKKKKKQMNLIISTSIHMIGFIRHQVKTHGCKFRKHISGDGVYVCQKNKEKKV